MVTGFTLQTCWLNPDTNDDWLECTVSSKCLGRHPLLGESQLVVHNYRTVFQNSSTFSLQRSLTSAECCAFLCCFRDQVGVYHWCFIFSSVVITTIHHLRALVIHLSRQRAEPLPSSFCSSILTNTISGVRPTFFHSLQCYCWWCCWCWRSLCSAYSAACLIWAQAFSVRLSALDVLNSFPNSLHRLAEIPRSSNSTIFVDDFLTLRAPEMKHQLV